MQYGRVITNLLDLNAKPAFLAERRSQLLFGEIVKVGSCRSGFVRVTESDGYAGWADQRFIEPAGKNDYIRFKNNHRYMVSASQASVYDKHSKPADPFFLYYGTRLRLMGRAGVYRRIDGSAGGSIYLKPGVVSPIMSSEKNSVTGQDLSKEARKLSGVPYLWGGVSPAGFDCSGLVRAVCRRFGLYMPRDTKEQIKMGRKIERICIKTGDLLFFDGHVGFAIGSSRLIHASRGGGGVRINSLRRGGKDYRPDLDADFNQARRIV